MAGVKDAQGREGGSLGCYWSLLCLFTLTRRVVGVYAMSMEKVKHCIDARYTHHLYSYTHTYMLRSIRSFPTELRKSERESVCVRRIILLGFLEKYCSREICDT